jgi:hypothetical protein
MDNTMDYPMTDRPMCSNCTLHKDKAFYAKYENMKALCDFCKTFQDSLFQAIDQEVGRIKTEPINLVN